MSAVSKASRIVLTVSVVSVSVLPWASPAFSESIMLGIVDGKPWMMVTEDGQSGELTLEEGGKGKMKGGPMGMRLTVMWREKGKLFCIKPGPLSERCMDMTSVDGGYDGYIDGKKFVSLRRQ
jgi:hypothetical protein